jgi:DNA-directed RNA polymerase subunit K/omega
MSDIEDEISDFDESIESVIDELEESISDITDEETPFDDIIQSKKSKDERKSINVLTKYEYATIIGNRAKDFDGGVVPNITVPEHMTSTIDIAELEMRQGKTPYIIRRYYGSAYEDWSLKELIVPKL